MLSSSFNLVAQGGFVVALLLALSVVALTVILVKFWQFWTLRLADDVQSVRSLLVAGRFGQALMALEAMADPRSHLLHHLLNLYQSCNLSLEQLRDEGMRLARQQVAQMAGHLRLLEVVATVAPLLGLFGTVLGMIEAFQAMEAAGSQVNPALLSGGIWQALLTTAVGLAVAIPVSMLHSLLERRVENRAALLLDELEQMLTLLAGRSSPHKMTAPVRAEVEFA